MISFVLHQYILCDKQVHSQSIVKHIHAADPYHKHRNYIIN